MFGASGAALWRAAALRSSKGSTSASSPTTRTWISSFRARLRGHEIWYAPRSVVRHARGGTAGQHVDFALFHPVKNRWFMIVKDTPGRTMAAPTALHRRRRGVLLGRTVRRRAPGALLRAYREVLRRRPERAASGG